MNLRFNPLWMALLAGLFLATAPGRAQDAKAPLAVSSIKPLPALSVALAASGKAASLARVVESYDSQLIDRLNASRKFEIVGRSDLQEIVKEQELAGSGNVAEGDPHAAQAGKLAGAKYLLVATIDDFEDTTERMSFTNLNKVGIKRKIRLSTTAKIYDSTAGKLMESAHVRLERKDDRMDASDLQSNAEATDALLLDITRAAAEQITTRVADIVFPIRVLSKRDSTITINRGEGAGVEPGMVFDVYVQGEELVDPDTGEVLGREEAQIGKARIVTVRPKLSTAEVLEDFGITRGAVLRPAAH
ncbi:MAG: CsgG/HfaB family protein [Verrucomicrobia bacterium]|nr:CsgG/HfaB family protein [Verrucomicrobiota bacterium]